MKRRIRSRSGCLLVALASGCACQVLDPSCGPQQELCRPVHCPPPCERSSCTDAFGCETWYAAPNCWRPPCPPFTSCYPTRTRGLVPGDVFQLPVPHPRP
jgi:hypothetical protein